MRILQSISANPSPWKILHIEKQCHRCPSGTMGAGTHLAVSTELVSFQTNEGCIRGLPSYNYASLVITGESVIETIPVSSHLVSFPDCGAEPAHDPHICMVTLSLVCQYSRALKDGGMEEIAKSPPRPSSSLEAVLPHQRLLWTPGEALTPASGR